MPSAFITGASKGIGRGLALGIAKAGWDLAINYYGDETGAKETVASCESHGIRCLAVQGDVGDAADMERMFAEIDTAFDSLQLMVNNAGRQTWAPLLELSEEDFDRTIKTNLKGSFLGTKLAALRMKETGGGSIVNIGSASNKHPFPRLVDYSASKGGLDRLTQVSAIELGEYGIRVNCVAPGAIEIERTQEESPNYSNDWSPITPLGRVGKPHDLVGATLFLADPEQSAYITGQTIYVDGGTFTRPPWPYQ